MPCKAFLYHFYGETCCQVSLKTAYVQPVKLLEALKQAAFLVPKDSKHSLPLNKNNKKVTSRFLIYKSTWP